MEGRKERKYEKDFSFEHPQSGDQSTLVSEAFSLQFSESYFSLDIAKSTTPGKENRNQANRQHFDHHLPIVTESVERHQYVSDSTQTGQKPQVARHSASDIGNRNFTRELSLAPTTGIGSNVWSELGQDDNHNHNKNKKNRNYIGPNNNAQLKDQTTTKDVNSKRPFWSKLLMCS